ncbi:DUF2513 domain-containing protein [Methanoregula sp.]|uniref:DUF2513 domain-containing protein n=1 Tax=Methanoregula sp. TaxID=2052170 RepID=UPI003C5B47B4
MPIIEGYSSDQVGYHAYLTKMNGLIEAAEVTSHESSVPSAIPYELTSKGYDFLDACRNETVWNKAKEKLKSMASDVSFEVMKALLVGIASKMLGI